jgi:hypothetical protein
LTRSVKAELCLEHLNTLRDFPAFLGVCDTLFQLKLKSKELHILSVLPAINVHDRLLDEKRDVLHYTRKCYRVQGEHLKPAARISNDTENKIDVGLPKRAETP